MSILVAWYLDPVPNLRIRPDPDPQHCFKDLICFEGPNVSKILHTVSQIFNKRILSNTLKTKLYIKNWHNYAIPVCHSKLKFDNFGSIHIVD
jgi:hypothetical protein